MENRNSSITSQLNKKTDSDKRRHNHNHVQFCAAINCRNNRYDNPNISFFRFPKDEERCKRWVINCRRKDMLGKSAAQLFSGSVLCANHFENSQFSSKVKNRLHPRKAVPTLFDVPNPPKRLSCKTAISQRFTGTSQRSTLIPPTPKFLLQDRQLTDGNELYEQSQSQIKPSSVQVTFDDLKKKYFSLSKKFEDLKELARINVDLLSLAINVQFIPEVKDDLIKLHELVQALMNEEEDNANPWKDIQVEERLSTDGTSLVKHLWDLVCVFTKDKVIKAFLDLLAYTEKEALGPAKLTSTSLDVREHPQNFVKLESIDNFQPRKLEERTAVQKVATEEKAFDKVHPQFDANKNCRWSTVPNGPLERNIAVQIVENGIKNNEKNTGNSEESESNDNSIWLSIPIQPGNGDVTVHNVESGTENTIKCEDTSKESEFVNNSSRQKENVVSQIFLSPVLDQRVEGNMTVNNIEHVIEHSGKSEDISKESESMNHLLCGKDFARENVRDSNWRHLCHFCGKRYLCVRKHIRRQHQMKYI